MNFFYYESKFKTKFFVSVVGGGGGGARVSEFFFTESKSTKRKMFFFLQLGDRRGGERKGEQYEARGGMGGQVAGWRASVSEFF